MVDFTLWDWALVGLGILFFALQYGYVRPARQQAGEISTYDYQETLIDIPGLVKNGRVEKWSRSRGVVKLLDDEREFNADVGVTCYQYDDLVNHWYSILDIEGNIDLKYYYEMVNRSMSRIEQIEERLNRLATLEEQYKRTALPEDRQKIAQQIEVEKAKKGSTEHKMYATLRNIEKFLQEKDKEDLDLKLIERRALDRELGEPSPETVIFDASGGR